MRAKDYKNEYDYFANDPWYIKLVVNMFTVMCVVGFGIIFVLLSPALFIYHTFFFNPPIEEIGKDPDEKGKQ